jgi:hypothetical protein
MFGPRDAQEKASSRSFIATYMLAAALATVKAQNTGCFFLENRQRRENSDTGRLQCEHFKCANTIMAGVSF